MRPGNGAGRGSVMPYELHTVVRQANSLAAPIPGAASRKPRVLARGRTALHRGHPPGRLSRTGREDPPSPRFQTGVIRELESGGERRSNPARGLKTLMSAHGVTMHAGLWWLRAIRAWPMRLQVPRRTRCLARQGDRPDR